MTAFAESRPPHTAPFVFLLLAGFGAGIGCGGLDGDLAEPIDSSQGPGAGDGLSDPSTNPSLNPSLEVNVELSRDSLESGGLLTATFEARNRSSTQTLEDVNLFLPSATGELDLVSANDEGAGDSHPQLDERRAIYRWAVGNLEPEGLVRHTIVLRAPEGNATNTIAGILGFARNERGPTNDNGLLKNAFVNALEGSSGLRDNDVDLELIPRGPSLRIAPGVYELSFEVRNSHKLHEATNVRVVGCLDPQMSYAGPAPEAEMPNSPARCWLVGFPKIAAESSGLVRFRMQSKDLHGDAEQVFTSVLVQAREPDAKLHNNWMIIPTRRDD